MPVTTNQTLPPTVITPSIPTISKALGYLGLIPFYAALYFTYVHNDLSGISPYTLFISYSALILTFLAGTLWSRSLAYKQLTPAIKNSALIISNLIMLSAWMSFILHPMYPVLSATILLCGFLIVAISEGQLAFSYNKEKDEMRLNEVSQFTCKEYLTLRKHLTLLVILAHIFFIVLTML